MNKRHTFGSTRALRSTRTGQALWMVISLITLFLFIGTLALVYMQMDFFQKEGMWPSDKTNIFMKRGDESVPVLPPPKRQAPAPVVPDATPADTNATPEGADAPDPAGGA